MAAVLGERGLEVRFLNAAYARQRTQESFEEVALAI